MATEHEMKSIDAATVMFEAEHKECVRVLPYTKDGQIVVQFYVFSGESGIPQDLKEEAQRYFENMNVKLEWSDLYNNSINILKVQRLEYPSGKPKTLTASQIDEMNEVINKNLPVLLKHRNVTSVQAHFKITKSKQSDKPCITIYVLGKGFIPFGESKFPDALGGYPVDVVNGFWVRAGKFWRPTEAQEQSDVLYLGASIGVEGKEASGTLGAVVKDGSSFYVLSCDHVMKPLEKSRRIVHPGLNDHLNFLKFHLGQYKGCVNDVTGLETQCSVATLTSREALLNKFEELKSIKQNHGDCRRYTRANLKKIERTEKAIEEGRKPPREIGEYIAGVSGNVKWTDGKEYFIDAAIAKLFDEEVKSLKQSRTAKMVESDINPGSGCSSTETKAILSANELCKSGRTTGYTEISNKIVGGTIVEAPHFMKSSCYKLDSPFLRFLMNKYLCESCAGSRPDGLDIEESSRCENCGRNKASLCRELWLMRCLCIQEGRKKFADDGDSGAVIFQKTQENDLLGFGLLFATQEHQYFRYIMASPLQIVLEALTDQISDVSSLELVSNYTE